MVEAPREIVTPEKIEELLKLGFPEIYNWVPMEYYQGIGPYYTHVVDEFSKRHGDWLEKGRRKFASFLGAAVDIAISELEMSGQRTSIRAINEAFYELNKLKSLYWWAGGFNVEGRRANFEYWVQLDEWQLDEAFALSIGFEPTVLHKENEEHFGVYEGVLDFAQKRRKLIERKFFKFGENPVFKPPPKYFCEWALDIKLEVPHELFEAHNKIRGTKFRISRTHQTEVPTIESREKMSMLRLIIGMAVGGYGYDVNAKRSPILNQICSDLELLGIPLHADTIRSYLREAQNLLPDNPLDE